MVDKMATKMVGETVGMKVDKLIVKWVD